MHLMDTLGFIAYESGQGIVKFKEHWYRDDTWRFQRQGGNIAFLSLGPHRSGR